MDRAKLDAVMLDLKRLETPDDVAEYLRANNIKGQAWNPLSCPVARLLAAKVGGTPSVGVWSASWPAEGDQRFGDRFSLPKPVSAFISAFDHTALYEDLKEDA